MTETEFKDAKEFWLIFHANETFKAVHRGCLELVRSGLSETSPLYFPLVAGLICLYGKPFKKSEGVGKLPIEMVPEDQLPLHNELIIIRDKIYAHSDASLTLIAGNLHFDELRYFRFQSTGGYYIQHLHIRPDFFGNFMVVLAERMIEKTQYHIELAKKLAPHLPRGTGEFLLNTRDEEAPLFTQVEPLYPGGL